MNVPSFRLRRPRAANGVAARCTTSALIAVVGVDVEAQDGVYLDGLIAAHRRAELPAVQRGQDLGGHGCGTGFENLEIAQIAGRFQSALHYHAGTRQIRRQIGAHPFRADQSSGSAGGRVDFGVLHHYGAQVRSHVNTVVVPGKLAVKIEDAARARSGDNGDRRAFISFDGGAAGKIGIVAAATARSEARQGNDRTAAANVDARNSRIAARRATCAAGTGGRRDSTARVGVGAAAGSGFSGAGTFAAHATAGAAAVPDARAIPRAAEAGLIAATGRHRQRTFAAAAGHAYFLPRLRG